VLRRLSHLELRTQKILDICNIYDTTVIHIILLKWIVINRCYTGINAVNI
jgi:hypothetical protein